MLQEPSNDHQGSYKKTIPAGSIALRSSRAATRYSVTSRASLRLTRPPRCARSEIPRSSRDIRVLRRTQRPDATSQSPPVRARICQPAELDHCKRSLHTFARTDHRIAALGRHAAGQRPRWQQAGGGRCARFRGGRPELDEAALGRESLQALSQCKTRQAEEDRG